MWFFDRIVSIKILPKIGQQLTSNITNVGRSGGLKASAPHQHLQLLTGKSPALRHWSYCKTLATIQNYIMKITFVLSIVICLLLICCTQNKDKQTSVITFNLREDMYNFSNKMRNGDTILINTILGVCTSNSMEYNTVFKQNDSVFIQSIITDIFPSGESKTLHRAHYSIANDTLNFESFFSFVKANSIENDMDSSYTLQVIHKRDTVEFFAENLVKALNQISYYMQVKGKIYPEEEVFKPDMITEGPILSN